jgi:hypothetical protein
MELWKDRWALERPWGPAGSLVGVAVEEIYEVAGARGPGPEWKVLAVTGPSGCGTSTVAGRVVRVLSCSPFAGRRDRAVRVLRVDLRKCRTDHQALVELFAHFDAQFTGKGFSAGQLAVLLSRRLRAEGTPFVLWLDNSRSTPSLPLLWSLFDPEEVEWVPGLRVVISGCFDPTQSAREGPEIRRIAVRPPTPAELRARISELCQQSFAWPPAPEVVTLVVERTRARGVGLAAAVELVREAGERAEARGASRVEEGDIGFPHLPDGRRKPLLVDAAILECLRKQGRRLPMSLLHRRVTEHLGQDGRRPPSASLLRRHVAALEARGMLSREFSLGGDGGSRSWVSL